MILVSASRRTDIPAFYSSWFMSRVRERRAGFVHPYTRKLCEVDLDPSRVAAVVFWTKNMRPMLEKLPALESAGFSRYLVHFTITGLGERFEPRAPRAEQAVETLKALSSRIGPDRVIWRFDPIILTRKQGVEQTLERFASLCQALSGQVRECVVSLVKTYGKVMPRLLAYARKFEDPLINPTPEELAELSSGLFRLAREHGLVLSSCCTPELSGFGIRAARCIDGGLVKRLWPELDYRPSPGPSRKGCHCHRAIDLGAYDTCLHSCLYCYANGDPETVKTRSMAHQPQARLLTPEPRIDPGEPQARSLQGEP